MEEKNYSADEIAAMRRKQRREMIRRRRFIMKVAVIFMLITSVLLTVIICNAVYKHKQNKILSRYETYVRSNECIVYGCYRIKWGDTVNTIVQDLIEEKSIPVPYSVEKRYIIQINQLYDADHIRVGETIIYPYVALKSDFGEE